MKTEEKAKHAPGPWEISLATHDKIMGRESKCFSIMSAINQEIARTSNIYPPDETEANARFIVQACNSHMDLVEALNKIDLIAADLASFSEICSQGRRAKKIGDELHRFIYKALAKAEGHHE